jgi:Protein of unknown function (DUF1573)
MPLFSPSRACNSIPQCSLRKNGENAKKILEKPEWTVYDEGLCPYELLGMWRTTFGIQSESESPQVFSKNLTERVVPPPALPCILLFLICSQGCIRTGSSVPGETYSAGYIFPDRQSKVTHDFVVRNTTSEPVKIYKVEKSCTCASFKLGKYQVAPGEATTLTIDVDVIPSYMQKFATCVLKTDHPQFKDWGYNIHFISVPFVVADPSDLNLGTFTVDGENPNAVQQANLDLFADSKIELTRHNFSVPNEIELNIVSGPEVRRLQRDVWNTRYQISIGLSPKGRETILHNSQSGLITKTIQLTAGEEKSKKWQYSVYWKALAPLESHPSSLSFGNLLDETDDHCRRIVILSTTNKEFQIVSDKNQIQEIRIESSVDASDEAPQHGVRFKAIMLGHGDAKGRSTGGPRRFLSGTIQVHTTDRRRPIVEIPWSAMLDSSVKLRSRADQPKSSSEPGL